MDPRVGLFYAASDDHPARATGDRPHRGAPDRVHDPGRPWIRRWLL